MNMIHLFGTFPSCVHVLIKLAQDSHALEKSKLP